MSKKLFVGGLAWATTDEGLREAFAPFGNLIEAKVIFDRQTGRSRGFGFVTYDSEESAAAAHEAMNGQSINGRAIRIDEADDTQKRSDKPRRNFNDRHRDAQPQGDRRPKRDADSADSRPEKRFSSPDYNNYIVDDNARGGRDNRRKDKKRDRDRYDDDRW